VTTISSIDPTTGSAVEVVTEETGSVRVAKLCTLAAAAAPRYEAMGRQFRATLLRVIAEALEARRTDIVTIGMRETALPESRLNGELTRTVYQFRFFAEVGHQHGPSPRFAPDAGALGSRRSVWRQQLPLGVLRPRG
jgi:NADP-dependent aldehyde dehydrogenase